MSLGVAIVGAATTLIVALLARLPGLTADDRRRTRLLRDAELWKELPPSNARDALAEHITTGTSSLLEERGKDRFVSDALTFLGWTWFVVFLALLARAAVPDGAPWAELLDVPLMVVLVSGTLAGSMTVLTLGVLGLVNVLAWVSQRPVLGPWLRRWRPVAWLARRRALSRTDSERAVMVDRPSPAASRERDAPPAQPAQ